MKTLFDDVKSRLVNMAPHNPTQTLFTRFMKVPHGEIRTAFTDSIEWFNEFKEKTETIYDRLIDDLWDGGSI